MADGSISFAVYGAPQGKARARTVRNKYSGAVHSFTPEKTREYEAEIAFAYRAKARGADFGDRPVNVFVQANFAPPKSFSAKKRASALTGDVQPRVKPDCDNILKVVLDALNGVAFADDKNVVWASCRKRYSEVPSIVVVIQEDRSE